MLEHVPGYLRHQYSLYDRNKKSGINFSCEYPEKVLSIDNQGHCFICNCDGWLPISVGHITEFKSIEDVWQSPIAKKIQKDIKNKNFTWCSVDYCGIRDKDIKINEYLININIDESCNLQCPTCRSDYMNFTKGKIYEKKLKWANHIVELLKNFNKHCLINMSGNGDPFASLIYRSMLMNIETNEYHTYKIMTNGLLLKKLLKKSPIYKNIKQYSISIDAGDEETYERVRLRGKWSVLIENLDFLKQELQDSHDIKVVLNFCLHNDNLKSLLNFIELSKKYQWLANIQSVEHWGSYSKYEFDNQNVLDSNHKDYTETIQLLKGIETSKNIMLSSNILEKINNKVDKN